MRTQLPRWQIWHDLSYGKTRVFRTLRGEREPRAIRSARSGPSQRLIPGAPAVTSARPSRPAALDPSTIDRGSFVLGLRLPVRTLAIDLVGETGAPSAFFFAASLPASTFSHAAFDAPRREGLAPLLPRPHDARRSRSRPSRWLPRTHRGLERTELLDQDLRDVVLFDSLSTDSPISSFNSWIAG